MDVSRFLNSKIDFSFEEDLTGLKSLILNQQWKDIKKLKEYHLSQLEYIHNNVFKILTAINIHENIDNEVFYPKEYQDLQNLLKKYENMEKEINKLDDIIDRIINTYPDYFK